jgi:protein tyrosine phosphatase (PTP) superfamily phosphohydrolase (DUF442 family)
MNAPVKLCLVLALVVLTAAFSDDPGTAPPKAPAGPFSPINNPHLHNAHRVTDRVLSGAQPEGEKSFEALAALGVKTIISVDGAKPDVEGARKYGIRYVHLPIGYDNVAREEGLALAKAIAELPGPIYVHCHHGRHRSAAAVAVGCVLNGSLKPELAESVLRTFGMGENYAGLWRSAREARALNAAVLRGVKVEYREVAPVPPLAEAMVLLDKRLDHLRQLQKNAWEAPPDHLDLDARHEALQLHEHLIELERGQPAAGKTPEYVKLMAETQEATRALREALAGPPVREDDARRAMLRVGRSCTACHAEFRD